MPCALREKFIPHRPRRCVGRDILGPKPVHPRAVRFHGLFGMSFVRQHQMYDERWTPNSLTEQFKGMADLLARRQVFKKLESKAMRKKFFTENRNLKLQCRDGRAKLQMILAGDNTHIIRNYLINHKDMQRLYQQMPIHLVVENINQRTFVMRKERDRLQHRLDQLKSAYKSRLLKRAELENRIKYQNEFVLDEELRSREFLKKIENSNVRLKAIKTINNTYKKMIQVLLHDEIFYEPILRSLSIDMEDQANFIKHILYVGMPAINKFKELNDEYRHMEEKSRKNLQSKIQILANYKKKPSIIHAPNKPKEESTPANIKRYVRETQSMMLLKLQLESIENTIKEIKFVTLCSQAKEIYPRIKSQVENNEKLLHVIETDMVAHQMLETKTKCATVLKDVLVNNLAEEEINRMERIKDLKISIEEEDKFEEATLTRLRNRADAYCLLRITLWNLVEILRHVDRQPKMPRTHYPNSYLKLPLLKFEMLNMRAAAPEIYEENIDKLMHLVKRKVYIVMKSYKYNMKPATIAQNVQDYHAEFLMSMEMDEAIVDTEQQRPVPEEDIIEEAKHFLMVPSRKQIKAQSAKLIDELAKKEE